jgi:hypothetical protein
VISGSKSGRGAASGRFAPAFTPGGYGGARLQITLDQCWDLLRQRRARRAAGLDPGEAQLRDEETVKGYTG